MGPFKSTAIILALIIAPVLAKAGESCSEPVETSAGMAQGITDYDACAWLGLPYAAPPTGDLRWRAPTPHPGWEGVRPADAYGPRCMQKGVMEALNADPSAQMSEDCLYLNVWRPKKSGEFPVMVWLHGGGYSTGTGNSTLYRGDRLSVEGEVVVVTINYRLNVFGYFANPGLRDEDPNRSTGNYGSLDQVTALRWVKENIRAFGGDPNNVTVFGESAGGRSVCTMLATPLAHGLFQRAILESGGCETCNELDKGYGMARGLVEGTGCGFEDIKCLRDVPAERLLEDASPGMVEGGLALVPHIDGYFLDDTPVNMIQRGDYNNVPFIAGYNKDEFGVAAYLMPDVILARSKNYEKVLAERLGLPDAEARRLATLYPLDDYDGSPLQAFRMIIRDGFHACPTTLGLSTASLHEPRAFLYRFDYDDMRFGSVIGALHSMEIPFVFDSMDRPPVDRLFPGKVRDEAGALSDVIQGYWTNFAATGDPNGPGLPSWPEYDPASPRLQVLDVDTRTESPDMDKRCEFWEEYSRRFPSPLGPIQPGP